MQLLELTSAELEFLKTHPAATDLLQQRLTQRLAASLSARLRMPVQLQMRAVPDAAETQPIPVWDADDVLATLWLTRRLGGQRVAGTAPFVPRTLIHALNEVLAECWLDGSEHDRLPSTLSWQVAAGHTQAKLVVHLPHNVSNMTHWARDVINPI